MMCRTTDIISYTVSMCTRKSIECPGISATNIPDFWPGGVRIYILISSTLLAYKCVSPTVRSTI